uniref:Alpha-methylacyl-CoA racemase-like n=1 Tax=Ciona intestinalis TaxID=7719 RepID=F6Z2W9_CIOIN|nr:alpha-methylacyl-CoA racemase-like [Ciona intestinalis]|eukprot:XP_002119276.1 alpha-methylacyl-CoA racemase-like [Ciona intestinalis]
MALAGIKVLELAGLAPTPFAGMILADFGAKVVRLDRIVESTPDTMARGKRSICVDLKQADGVNVVRKLAKKSDVLIEPFRPGIMEKLGLGPARLLEENPRLVYVRLSGFGQNGPYRNKAGHDINYIATSGVLSMLRRKDEKPTAPVNLLADFAGGGLTSAFGVVTALFERERSGKGQVIDANMVEGSAYVSSFLFCNRFLMPNPPGENILDTAAPFYDTYQTKDGKFVSVGAIEPKFYNRFIEGLKLKLDPGNQMKMDEWPRTKEIIRHAILQHTRAELSEIFSDDDNCVMPVLDYDEVTSDPHNNERRSFFTDPSGKHIPIPAPRLSRTPGTPDRGAQPMVGAHTREVLTEYGFSGQDINHLLKIGAVHDTNRSKL